MCHAQVIESQLHYRRERTEMQIQADTKQPWIWTTERTPN